MCEPGREHGGTPSLGSLFNNWREYDAPPHVKLRLAVANFWTRLRTASNCCGHPGQPGC